MWKRIISTSLLLLLLLWLPGMCSAETDQQDKQDLMQLKTQLVVLSQNNEQLAINLTTSEQDLMRALEQLDQSETQITLLKKQLEQQKLQLVEAKTLSKTTENDLQNANQLLTEWKKEQDKEMAKLKQENKVYKLVLVGLIAKALM